MSDYYRRMELIAGIGYDDKLTMSVLWDCSRQCVKKGDYYVFTHNDRTYNLLVNEEEIIVEERTKIDDETRDRVITLYLDDFKYSYFSCMHDKNGSSYLTRYFSEGEAAIPQFELSTDDFLADLNDILGNLDSSDTIRNIVNIEEFKNYIVGDVTSSKEKSSILFQDFPPLRITEETRRGVLENPRLYTSCGVRVFMGKFYTDEEFAKYREESLGRPLPGGDGPTLVKKNDKKTNNK